MAPPEYRTPPYGYPGDPPCEDCGAAGGVACFLTCPTGGDPDLPFLWDPGEPLVPRRTHIPPPPTQ
jgi:hypothetical protein